MARAYSLICESVSLRLSGSGFDVEIELRFPAPLSNRLSRNKLETATTGRTLGPIFAAGEQKYFAASEALVGLKHPPFSN